MQSKNNKLILPTNTRKEKKNIKQGIQEKLHDR